MREFPLEWRITLMADQSVEPKQQQRSRRSVETFPSGAGKRVLLRSGMAGFGGAVLFSPHSMAMTVAVAVGASVALLLLWAFTRWAINLPDPQYERLGSLLRLLPKDIVDLPDTKPMSSTAIEE